MVKPLLIIALLGTLCGGLLSAVDHWTKPRILENHAAQREAVFQEIVPGPLERGDLAARMQHDDCTTWLAGTAITTGYGGVMEFAYVADPLSHTISLRNVRHRETPGFGDFITGSWLADRDRSDVTVWLEVDNVSGATITSQAVRSLAIDSLQAIEDRCREQ